MEDWGKYRQKIIGLGEHSFRKSYYPELQRKIEELEISQSNLQAIFNNTSDGIVIHDLKGQFLALNSQAIELFGISEDNIEKYHVSDVSAKPMALIEVHKIWEMTTNNIPQVFEWTVLQKNTKEEIDVQISINKTIWNGETAIVAVVRNFTKRKEYEEELINARKKAEEHDLLKSAFLANMSHEIRTPINGILGFAELLEDHNISEEKKDYYVNIIKKSGDRLLNLINDFVDLSKIESGQVSIKLEDVNITEILDELCNLFRPECDRKNIELIFQNTNSTNPLILNTDKNKLPQIFINLINNAIKHSNSQSITFGYKKEQKQIVFFVKDTGDGIPKDSLDKIFVRFQKASTSMANPKEGSGLGLSISKAFIELMGGEIWIESTLGQGACFYFSLPL